MRWPAASPSSSTCESHPPVFGTSFQDWPTSATPWVSPAACWVGRRPRQGIHGRGRNHGLTPGGSHSMLVRSLLTLVLMLTFVASGFASPRSEADPLTREAEGLGSKGKWSDALPL